MKTTLDFWRPERWHPWRELSSLQRQMDRLMNELSGSSVQGTGQGARGDIDFIPPCDVEESDTDYLISIDVPGMKKEDLQVELTGNTLRVWGEHHEQKREGKGSRRLTERSYGSFERTFTLPDLSDAGKVEAAYKDGVLHLCIPKTPTTKARRVPIGEGTGASFAKIGGRTDEKTGTEKKAASA